MATITKHSELHKDLTNNRSDRARNDSGTGDQAKTTSERRTHFSPCSTVRCKERRGAPGQTTICGDLRVSEARKGDAPLRGGRSAGRADAGARDPLSVRGRSRARSPCGSASDRTQSLLLDGVSKRENKLCEPRRALFRARRRELTDHAVLLAGKVNQERPLGRTETFNDIVVIIVSCRGRSVSLVRAMRAGGARDSRPKKEPVG